MSLVFMLGAGCDGSSRLPTPPLVQVEDRAPSWSPDNRWIAYVHFNPDLNDTAEPNGVYVISPAGTMRRLVIQGFPRAVDWSPNSEWLVFNDAAGLHVVSLAGDSLRTIYSGGSYPSWSPDGFEIAFSTTSRVWAISSDGTGLRPVTPSGFPSGDADWSPDGRRMVLLGNQGSTGEEVFTFTLADSLTVALTNDGHEDRSPRWSPRGDLIAWNAWPRASGQVRPELWVMDTLGGGRRRLATAETVPAWDPSGRFIAFSDQTGSGIRLFVIGANGTGLRQLTR